MADMRAYLEDALATHEAAIASVTCNAEPIFSAVETIVVALRAGNSLLFCGNGGSAADAQHLAAEFVGRFARDRMPWPAQALHVNTSALTAIGNDYGFDAVFARQVEAFGRPGDVLVALSTSGESPNVIAAMRAARDRGMKVVALSGGVGGSMAQLADVTITVDASPTPRVQEAHIFVGHVICGLAEEALCETP